MKIPFSWIKEHLATQLPAEKLADILTSIGLEVDGIRTEEDGDQIFEISLTPNLVHCASARGIARELAAVTNEKLLPLRQFELKEKKEESIDHSLDLFVEDEKACPRYTCRIIQGIKNKSTPDWLKSRIEKSGLRSVNLVADITNFVLLELGHPLHAFDFDAIHEKKVIVRNARKNEKIQTLDEKEYYPAENTLLICDADRPIAIAGVIGSQDSKVNENTQTVLLESAYFEPKQVRRTGKRMDIHTEASYRFERGTDPNGVIEALDHAASLICELAEGTCLKGRIDRYPHVINALIVSCRLNRVNQLLGTQLAMGEIETIFRKLDLKIHSIRQNTIEVEVPTYRHDIQQEIDLIEEIARIYGYNNLHKKDKPCFRLGSLSHSPAYLFEKRIRRCLIGEGLQEFITCNLISQEEASIVSAVPSRSWIHLLNPNSSDQAVMRPSLLPGMLQSVKYNADHEIHTLAAFEIGRVHFLAKDHYLEPTVASLILTGSQTNEHWEQKAKLCTFYVLKGMVENLLEDLKIQKAHFHASSYKNFHPWRQAVITIDEVEIGIVGELHPETLEKVGLHHPVLFAELNLEDLHQFVPQGFRMAPLAQFPASSRDWTITVKDEYPAGSILELLQSHAPSLLEKVSPYGVYKSDALGAEWKNLTFRFIYRDKEKTILVEEVEQAHNALIQKVLENLNEGIMK